MQQAKVLKLAAAAAFSRRLSSFISSHKPGSLSSKHALSQEATHEKSSGHGIDATTTNLGPSFKISKEGARKPNSSGMDAQMAGDSRAHSDIAQEAPAGLPTRKRYSQRGGKHWPTRGFICIGWVQHRPAPGLHGVEEECEKSVCWNAFGNTAWRGVDGRGSESGQARGGEGSSKTPLFIYRHISFHRSTPKPFGAPTRPQNKTSIKHCRSTYVWGVVLLPSPHSV